MIVNGREYNVDELMKSIDLNAHKFQTFNNIMLTQREIEILDRNFIDYRTATSLKDLMIKIQDILEDEDLDGDDADDLEYVLEQISERDYYENTNK
jgi:hypothetical protein